MFLEVNMHVWFNHACFFWNVFIVPHSAILQTIAVTNERKRERKSEEEEEEEEEEKVVSIHKFEVDTETKCENL